MYWHDMEWWAWFPMTLGMLVLWGLVAWLVVRLASAPSTGDRAAEPSAREVLDMRLARGEIATEEYEAARRLLDREPPASGAAATGHASDEVHRVSRV